MWIQRVSSDPSTGADVIELERSLNRELQRRHARQNGLCSIRSELYSQCFGKEVAGGKRLWGSDNTSRPTYRRCALMALLLHFFLLDELIRQMTVNCGEGSASLPCQS